jgi:hypothetical protein
LNINGTVTAQARWANLPAMIWATILGRTGWRILCRSTRPVRSVTVSLTSRFLRARRPYSGQM